MARMKTGKSRLLGSFLGTALLVSLAAVLSDRAAAMYPPDGTKPDGMSGYINPGDGMCVVGVKADGTMLIDAAVTNARDCVAYTTGLTGMTTSAACLNAGGAGNDGYRHAWVTSNICVNSAAPAVGISLVDLDRTTAMCRSRGGTSLTSTGTCVAYGWVYMNRKADGSLPVSGSGLFTTDGVQSTDNLGFCYASMRMTSATYNSSATCPSFHNSATGNAAEWPACASSTSGCQTQASFDAGLGWSWDSTNGRCLYAYGVTGILNATATKADGTTTAAGTTVDLTAITNQGDCLAAGYAWDNWLPNINRTTKTNADAGYEGLPAGAAIVKLDALTPVKDGGGNFHSGTGAVCTKCHTDQSRAYQERNKPGFIETRHKMAGDSIGSWQTFFTDDNSDWGLQGVQCAMCHSTARAAQDDLIQVVPAGVVGPPAAGSPVSATGHNRTEYGSHVTDVCFHCHGHFPSGNAGHVVPVAGGDLALTGKGLAPIGNQFLNSPHGQYTGTTSTKVDIGNSNNYQSPFTGYVCRLGLGALSSTTYPNQTACQNAGHTWVTNACHYNQTSCTTAGFSWASSVDVNQYPWATTTGGVCYGVGQGSIVTTTYRLGVVHHIPNLDSPANPACTNPGDGSATSGAAGFWVKEGEYIAGGVPNDSSQGNCMTCHDVHWALADTNPEAEPFKRECTTCHVNSGMSATGAPQIDLGKINHLKTAGTPLEHLATNPSESCETCHMPKSSATGSRMHLWRINTDAGYDTMGATQVNTAADGSYTPAGWVDLDLACGQCHGGDAGPADPGIPYFTKAQLALVAEGMHDGSGVGYPVTFSASVVPNSLTVNVDAMVDCGGPCPAFTYDWDWGDATAHGTADPDAHTFTSVGSQSIKLAVRLASTGKLVGSVTRSLRLKSPDLPPTAASAAPCTWDANLWKMTVVDASTDDGPDADSDAGDGNASLQIVIDWGDGTSRSIGTQGATYNHTYIRAGSYLVTHSAIDSKLRMSSTTCASTATPATFTISGTVKNTAGTANLASAAVQVRNGSTTVKTVYTSATGTFSAGSLKPGTYNLFVARAGYTFAAPAATITVGPSSAGNVIQATAP